MAETCRSDAGENGNDSDCDSDVEFNPALPACDISVPSVNELPSLTFNEINLEKCRDDNVMIEREWIDAARAPT